MYWPSPICAHVLLTLEARGPQVASTFSHLQCGSNPKAATRNTWTHQFSFRWTPDFLYVVHWKQNWSDSWGFWGLYVYFWGFSLNDGYPWLSYLDLSRNPGKFKFPKNNGNIDPGAAIQWCPWRTANIASSSLEWKLLETALDDQTCDLPTDKLSTTMVLQIKALAFWTI